MKTGIRSFGPRVADRVRRISSTAWKPAGYKVQGGCQPNIIETAHPMPWLGLGR